MRALRGLLFVISVYALANVYLAVSLERAIGSQLVWVFVGTLFLFSLSIPVLQRVGESFIKNRPWLRWIFNLVGVLAFVGIGIFSLLLVFSTLRDIVLFIAEFFLSQAHYELLSVGSFRFELGILCGLLIAGLVQAFKGPSVHHVKIPIAGLPKAFDGFRIIQVSDLHIGLTIRTAYVRNVVKLVNESAADLIALTGDITDGSPVELGAIANQLSEMRSTYGRYFVTGNHEYYWNALGWIEYHRAAGTHVLINESRLITKDGATIAILGVPDVKGYQFVPSHVSDPQRAAAGVPSGTIKILLAHQPISYKKAQIAGVHLQLSGHTHSGQYFPFNLLIGFFQDYYRGLNRFKDMWIYVNPGTGYWGPPLRTAVASEITAITLTCA